jgi:hypothetical protein
VRHPRRRRAVIEAERPNAVLVLGDTNSCIAALMARRMKVPVYQMGRQPLLRLKRTRKRLKQRAPEAASLNGVAFHEPFGLPDYAWLQTSARCTLSDNGTVSEESAISRLPRSDPAGLHRTPRGTGRRLDRDDWPGPGRTRATPGPGCGGQHNTTGRWPRSGEPGYVGLVDTDSGDG